MARHELTRAIRVGSLAGRGKYLRRTGSVRGYRRSVGGKIVGHLWSAVFLADAQAFDVGAVLDEQFDTVKPVGPNRPMELIRENVRRSARHKPACSLTSGQCRKNRLNQGPP